MLLGTNGPAKAQDSVAEDADYSSLERGVTAELTVELPDSPPWPPTDAVKAFEEDLPNCELTVRYIDETGDEFTTRRGIETATDIELQPGEAETLILRANAVLGPNEQGREFRPSVRVAPQSEVVLNTSDPCQRVVPTLEVTDRSGETTVEESIPLTD